MIARHYFGAKPFFYDQSRPSYECTTPTSFYAMLWLDRTYPNRADEQIYASVPSLDTHGAKANSRAFDTYGHNTRLINDASLRSVPAPEGWNMSPEHNLILFQEPTDSETSK